MSKYLAKKFGRLNIFSFGKERKEVIDAALEREYTVEGVLGTGGFGTVYAGVRKADKMQVAIKHIAKQRVTEWVDVPIPGSGGDQTSSSTVKLPVEICLLQKLTHIPAVVQLIEYYENDASFIIVLERPSPSRDLFDYITDRGCLSESEAADFVRQIVDMLAAIHDAGVIHRDLKDENLLVELDTGRLRLIDFGSGTFYRDDLYTDFEGTRVYSPPEWITNHCYYGMPATIWSIGILLHDMTCGDIPFQTDLEVIAAKLALPSSLSEEVRDLIQRCLTIDPAHRLSNFGEILNDPWMRRFEPPSTSDSSRTGSSPAAASIDAPSFITGTCVTLCSAAADNAAAPGAGAEASSSKSAASVHSAVLATGISAVGTLGISAATTASIVTSTAVSRSVA